MFWLCHCLFDFRILMRQGWLLNCHTTASERYGDTFAVYISHCIPIYSHIIPSYPFIQFGCHKYNWSKLHSFLSAGWGHHRRGSIAEARLCWGKALGTLKAYCKCDVLRLKVLSVSMTSTYHDIHLMKFMLKTLCQMCNSCFTLCGAK